MRVLQPRRPRRVPAALAILLWVMLLLATPPTHPWSGHPSGTGPSTVRTLAFSHATDIAAMPHSQRMPERQHNPLSFDLVDDASHNASAPASGVGQLLHKQVLRLSAQPDTPHERAPPLR
jgi:hypothetical protein